MQTIKNKSRFEELLSQSSDILGVYFSAGYPYLNATAEIARLLQDGGADFIEIGMPYSDPLADGPVIEACHQQAIRNGMHMNLMFNQIKEVRHDLKIPVVLMGYFNPVFKYGIEKFCEQCADTGIDAVILPDMPVELYAEQYHQIFSRHGLSAVFLATPLTPPERLKLIDKYSHPFLYLVSSSSTTGQTKGISEQQMSFFEEVKKKVSTPVMVGFGISTNEDYINVNKSADGAIIGSAFLRAIEGAVTLTDLKPIVKNFINTIKNDHSA